MTGISAVRISAEKWPGNAAIPGSKKAPVHSEENGLAF